MDRKRAKRTHKWLVTVAYVLDLRVGRYGRSRYLRWKRKNSRPLRILDRVALLGCVPVIAFFVWFVSIREVYPVPDFFMARRVTEHLEVYTDLGEEKLDFQIAFFEQFFEYFQREYFPFHPKERLRMYLFATTEGFRRYGEGRRTFPRGNLGFYSSDFKLVFVNRESGLGTATHELVHYFNDCGFVRELPPWADEGIANFFEKFIGHIDKRGQLHISVGYFNAPEFTYSKTAAKYTTLDHVFNSEDQPLQRSLMMFLHKKGLFASFVKELHANQLEASAIETLTRVYDADLRAIEAEWKAWIAAQPLDENITLVRAAFVMNQKDWDGWWKQNSGRLFWDAGERTYKVREPKAIVDR